ncbi:DUF1826 domain-containing protein [Spongiimicrobium salis]|uniref:DUF1826 domain-containing protein n=1 Tax=Spongiimicrobium salis TaxID=1667022 RepID=UPI00374DD2EE
MTPIHLLADNAVIGSDPILLQGIHLEAKNLSIYQRRITALEKGLDQVIKQPLEFGVSGRVEEIDFSLRTYFTNAHPERVDFMEDILNLLGLFKQVTRASSFRVSLAKVSTNMCPRFHADNNQLRMLCTYYGPGTLCLPDQAEDRKAYLTGQGNQKILTDESLVIQVNTGDVVILKGALYPGAVPVLHRSPSIEENGGERILLSIDLNEPLNFPL